MRTSEIRKLGSDGDVAGLAEIYKSGGLSDRKRQKVVHALASIMGEESTVVLAEILLHDPDDLTRSLAAMELGSPERSAFERGLVEVNMTESPMVLTAVARGLARSPSTSSIRILTDLVVHPDRDVRKYALDALVDIGGPDVFEAICLALNDSEWDTRFKAAEAVMESRDARAVDLLENQIKIESGVKRLAVREMAAKARDRINS